MTIFKMINRPMSYTRLRTLIDEELSRREVQNKTVIRGRGRNRGLSRGREGRSISKSIWRDTTRRVKDRDRSREGKSRNRGSGKGSGRRVKERKNQERRQLIKTKDSSTIDLIAYIRSLCSILRSE